MFLYYLSSVGVLVWGVQCGALTSYLLEESLQLWFWFDYQGVWVLTILHFCPFYFHCHGYFFISLVVENLFCQLSIIVSKLYPESRSQNYSPIIFLKLYSCVFFSSIYFIHLVFSFFFFLTSWSRDQSLFFSIE